MSAPAAFDAETFARALLDPTAPPPMGLPERRFAVYRNNVVVGLIDALAERFPACQRLVGEQFFRAMAGVHARATPPRSPMLAEYGDRFADFIANFPPARDLPYLADVARLEYVIGLAYHAADAAPLPIDAIKAISPEKFGRSTLVLHPSLHLVASRHPIVSIWRTNTFDASPRAVELGEAQDALVVRAALDIETHVLPSGGYALLAALLAGASVDDAIGSAANAAPGLDLAECLRLVLSSGAIVGLRDQ
ncbi:MAG: DNA-binding domain-containing protein [Methylocystis sp.]